MAFARTHLLTQSLARFRFRENLTQAFHVRYHFFLFLSFALLKNRHTYFILSTQCLFDGVAVVVVVVVDGAAAAAACHLLLSSFANTLSTVTVMTMAN